MSNFNGFTNTELQMAMAVALDDAVRVGIWNDPANPRPPSVQQLQQKNLCRGVDLSLQYARIQWFKEQGMPLKEFEESGVAQDQLRYLREGY